MPISFVNDKKQCRALTIFVKILLRTNVDR